MNVHTKVRRTHIARSSSNHILSYWPARSRHLAHSLIKQYGTPHEATPNMLIWYYTGPWKRTVVHREGAHHNVPHSHVDILEQTIDSKIPPEASAEIIKFDGSVIVDRTRGEMTAHCENEQANIFLLNLAHEIALGMKSANEARKALLDGSDLFHSMLPNYYRDSLLFTPSSSETSDPDMATVNPN